MVKIKDIPKHPEDAYKNKGFTTVGDWLGTGYVANKQREYLPIKEAKIEARRLVKKLGIKSNQDWIAAHKAGKIPENLPRYLHDIYSTKRKNRK